MTKNAIVKGSLSAIAKSENSSIAEVFLGAEIIVLLDWSGSMVARDAGGGKSRKQVAQEHLVRLQEAHPGKVGLICFADYPIFCPNGSPLNCGGCTALEKALRYVKPVDDTDTKIVIVSDGLPNDEEETLRVARTFKTKLDVIYIGDERDPTGGRVFLQKLAEATGGQFFKADSPGLLVPSVETLMLTG
jgi:Mg-chelatase subunit ChlD